MIIIINLLTGFPTLWQRKTLTANIYITIEKQTWLKRKLGPHIHLFRTKSFVPPKLGEHLSHLIHCLHQTKMFNMFNILKNSEKFSFPKHGPKKLNKNKDELKANKHSGTPEKIQKGVKNQNLRT